MSGWGRAAAFESGASLREEVSDRDIHLSRLTGIAPADVDQLADFSREAGLLIVVRCPKRPARYYHGRFAPKSLETSLYRDPKTGRGLKSDPETGLVTRPDGVREVSDYDLMCVYRSVGRGEYRKVPFSGRDAMNKRSSLGEEAQALLRRLEGRLKSAIQHGAQDDYMGPDHPNVSHGDGRGVRPDRFAVFHLGGAEYHPSPEAVRRKVYDRYGLDWPYDAAGLHASGHWYRNGKGE